MFVLTTLSIASVVVDVVRVLEYVVLENWAKATEVNNSINDISRNVVIVIVVEI